ncbi:hypothetical protein MHYP_G00168600 [Metynnis hypsauchen]
MPCSKQPSKPALLSFALTHLTHPTMERSAVVPLPSTQASELQRSQWKLGLCRSPQSLTGESGHRHLGRRR